MSRWSCGRVWSDAQDQQHEQPRPLASSQRGSAGRWRHATGQVVGATNRYGEEPADRPVTFQEVFATLYHNMGLDAGNVRLLRSLRHASLPNRSGR
ncbi:MAG: hypothetical protein R3B96_08595 [Pirellulaceae bacterium]